MIDENGSRVEGGEVAAIYKKFIGIVERVLPIHMLMNFFPVRYLLTKSRVWLEMCRMKK